MLQPPHEANVVLNSLEIDSSNTPKHLFFQQQAHQYQRKNAGLSSQLETLRKNVAENQENYDAIYSILYQILHHDIYLRTQSNNLKKQKQSCSYKELFIKEFNQLFEVDKTCFIHLNRPYTLNTKNRCIQNYSRSYFWDDEMMDLFNQQQISFAPINYKISSKLFTNSKLRSAGMIPFNANFSTGFNTKCKPKPAKKSNYNAMFVFGSYDEKRFLPDSTYSHDLLIRIQNMLSAL